MNENKNKNIKQDQGSQSDTRTPPSGQPMRSPQQQDTQKQAQKPGQDISPDQDQDKRRQ
ncbi:MAG TPA: hypothetical protein VGM88_13640 [Kofleriaceae bacterium]|jgi:hypothetical protein